MDLKLIKLTIIPVFSAAMVIIAGLAVIWGIKQTILVFLGNTPSSSDSDEVSPWDVQRSDDYYPENTAVADDYDSEIISFDEFVDTSYEDDGLTLSSEYDMNKVFTF